VSKLRCADCGGVRSFGLRSSPPRLGNRIHRTPETGVWNGERTWYLYAGMQLISEYEDAASQSYNPGNNAGSAGSDSTAAILYQHADHPFDSSGTAHPLRAGLTTRLTTENEGDLSNEQRHYPFGEPLQGGHSQREGGAQLYHLHERVGGRLDWWQIELRRLPRAARAHWPLPHGRPGPRQRRQPPAPQPLRVCHLGSAEDQRTDCTRARQL
jgi:hypothetical protein